MISSLARRALLPGRLKLVAALALAAGMWVPVDGAAQQGGLVAVDTVIVEGNRRVQTSSVLTVFGIRPGQEVSYRDLQRAIKQLIDTGQFRDVVIRARGTDPVTLVVVTDERPVLRSVQFNGLEHLSVREVADTADLRAGIPLNPQRILDAKAFIRAELSERGIPFAQITERIDPVGEGRNEVDLTLDVTEGQRVTIAQVAFNGNEGLPDEVLEGVMRNRSEGFLWFRPGSFDEDEYRSDLEERLPSLYRARGFLDFRIESDTIVVDPETGKARIEVEVVEGPQYRLGSFTVEGNTRFPSDELEGYVTASEGGLLSALGFGGERQANAAGEVFDGESFDEAMQDVMERYRNEGYLYVQVNPVLDRHEASEDQPATVDATWEIVEGAPAIINRVSIVGNEYTYDWVIRNQLFVIPGDVYSQDRLLRSYQNISSLGFFETPLPFPDIQPTETGDVDITFNVAEKQTGSVNFGTSVGGGVGLSGFIGYDQPNLFGQAKSGSLRWDFGQYLNSFETSYSDPALFQSMVSGSVSLFNSRDRYFQFSTGQRRRVGSSVRFGLPWPDSRVTRIFIGYSISRTKYELFDDVDDQSLFGRPPGVQSQASIGVTRQTLDHPLFPTVGSRQNVNFELNGGLLGGDGNFTRVLADGSWWVPVGRLGGSDGPAGGGARLTLGLTLRSGLVLGDAEAFPFDRFWMGGVQFGQSLRGYDETSITPLGFFPERSAEISDIERLGNGFFSMSAEYAMRVTGQISVSAFYDAGNVWRNPSEFDPTRLYRGAGFGAKVMSPFGPIGLDYAYGFDKAEPGWQLHFRMGAGL